MRVAVNVTSSNKATSFHRDQYLGRLLRSVTSIQDEIQFVLLTSPDSSPLYNGFECIETSPSIIRKGFLGLGGSSGELSRAMKQAKADVALSLLNEGIEKPGLPELLLVHDLGPWELESQKGGVGAVNKHIKRHCNQADALFMPSEHLRRRCLDLFEVPLNRGSVGLPGLDPVFRTEQSTMVDLPYVILYLSPLVSSCMEQVFKVREQLEAEFEHTIVIAGPGLPAEPTEWDGRVVRIEYLPDNHLTGLYQHASAFIYPGLHDGCGYAVLEALGAGLPVVAARSGALQEIAKDIPIYFNPGSSESLLQGVRRVLGFSKSERAQRVHLGQSITSNYTWEKAAWKLVSALQRL